MAKKFSKKMSAEERKEFKGGKYMGGPAEEKAEKKKGTGMGGAVKGAGCCQRGMKKPRMK